METTCLLGSQSMPVLLMVRDNSAAQFYRETVPFFLARGGRRIADEGNGMKCAKTTSSSCSYNYSFFLHVQYGPDAALFEIGAKNADLAYFNMHCHWFGVIWQLDGLFGSPYSSNVVAVIASSAQRN